MISGARKPPAPAARKHATAERRACRPRDTSASLGLKGIRRSQAANVCGDARVRRSAPPPRAPAGASSAVHHPGQRCSMHSTPKLRKALRLAIEHGGLVCQGRGVWLPVDKAGPPFESPPPSDIQAETREVLTLVRLDILYIRGPAVRRLLDPAIAHRVGKRGRVARPTHLLAELATDLLWRSLFDLEIVLLPAELKELRATGTDTPNGPLRHDEWAAVWADSELSGAKGTVVRPPILDELTRKRDVEWHRARTREEV